MNRECSGRDVPDVTLQRGKENDKLHSYPKRSIPKTLFGTLTNLLLAAQKQLSVRTLIIQKPVK